MRVGEMSHIAKYQERNVGGGAIVWGRGNCLEGGGKEMLPSLRNLELYNNVPCRASSCPIPISTPPLRASDPYTMANKHACIPILTCMQV